MDGLILEKYINVTNWNRLKEKHMILSIDAKEHLIKFSMHSL